MVNLIVMLAILSPFAPAPLAKPLLPVISPVGEWILEWRGGEGPCRFAADGGFQCQWAGKQWLGLWTLEGNDLVVSEWIPAYDELTPASANIKWTAILLEGKLEGKLIDGGNFRLRKQIKAKHEFDK